MNLSPEQKASLKSSVKEHIKTVSDFEHEEVSRYMKMNFLRLASDGESSANFYRELDKLYAVTGSKKLINALLRLNNLRYNKLTQLGRKLCPAIQRYLGPELEYLPSQITQAQEIVREELEPAKEEIKEIKAHQRREEHTRWKEIITQKEAKPTWRHQNELITLEEQHPFFLNEFKAIPQHTQILRHFTGSIVIPWEEWLTIFKDPRTLQFAEKLLNDEQKSVLKEMLLTPLLDTIIESTLINSGTKILYLQRAVTEDAKNYYAFLDQLYSSPDIYSDMILPLKQLHDIIHNNDVNLTRSSGFKSAIETLSIHKMGPFKWDSIENKAGCMLYTGSSIATAIDRLTAAPNSEQEKQERITAEASIPRRACWRLESPMPKAHQPPLCFPKGQVIKKRFEKYCERSTFEEAYQNAPGSETRVAMIKHPKRAGKALQAFYGENFKDLEWVHLITHYSNFQKYSAKESDIINSLRVGSFQKVALFIDHHKTLTSLTNASKKPLSLMDLLHLSEKTLKRVIEKKNKIKANLSKGVSFKTYLSYLVFGRVSGENKELINSLKLTPLELDTLYNFPEKLAKAKELIPFIPKKKSPRRYDEIRKLWKLISYTGFSTQELTHLPKKNLELLIKHHTGVEHLIKNSVTKEQLRNVDSNRLSIILTNIKGLLSSCSDPDKATFICKLLEIPEVKWDMVQQIITVKGYLKDLAKNIRLPELINLNKWNLSLFLKKVTDAQSISRIRLLTCNTSLSLAQVTQNEYTLDTLLRKPIREIEAIKNLVKYGLDFEELTKPQLTPEEKYLSCYLRSITPYLPNILQSIQHEKSGQILWKCLRKNEIEKAVCFLKELDDAEPNNLEKLLLSTYFQVILDHPNKFPDESLKFLSACIFSKKTRESFLKTVAPLQQNERKSAMPRILHDIVTLVKSDDAFKAELPHRAHKNGEVFPYQDYLSTLLKLTNSTQGSFKSFISASDQRNPPLLTLSAYRETNQEAKEEVDRNSTNISIKTRLLIQHNPMLLTLSRILETKGPNPIESLFSLSETTLNALIQDQDTNRCEKITLEAALINLIPEIERNIPDNLSAENINHLLTLKEIGFNTKKLLPILKEKRILLLYAHRKAVKIFLDEGSITHQELLSIDIQTLKSVFNCCDDFLLLTRINCPVKGNLSIADLLKRPDIFSRLLSLAKRIHKESKESFLELLITKGISLQTIFDMPSKNLDILIEGVKTLRHIQQLSTITNNNPTLINDITSQAPLFEEALSSQYSDTLRFYLHRKELARYQELEDRQKEYLNSIAKHLSTIRSAASDHFHTLLKPDSLVDYSFKDLEVPIIDEAIQFLEQKKEPSPTDAKQLSLFFKYAAPFYKSILPTCLSYLAHRYLNKAPKQHMLDLNQLEQDGREQLLTSIYRLIDKIFERESLSIEKVNMPKKRKNFFSQEIDFDTEYKADTFSRKNCNLEKTITHLLAVLGLLLHANIEDSTILEYINNESIISLAALIGPLCTNSQWGMEDKISKKELTQAIDYLNQYTLIDKTCSSSLKKIIERESKLYANYLNTSAEDLHSTKCTLTQMITFLLFCKKTNINLDRLASIRPSRISKTPFFSIVKVLHLSDSSDSTIPNLLDIGEKEPLLLSYLLSDSFFKLLIDQNKKESQPLSLTLIIDFFKKINLRPSSYQRAFPKIYSTDLTNTNLESLLKLDATLLKAVWKYRKYILNCISWPQFLSLELESQHDLCNNAKKDRGKLSPPFPYRTMREADSLKKNHPNLFIALLNKKNIDSFDRTLEGWLANLIKDNPKRALILIEHKEGTEKLLHHSRISLNRLIDPDLINNQDLTRVLRQADRLIASKPSLASRFILNPDKNFTQSRNRIKTGWTAVAVIVATIGTGLTATGFTLPFTILSEAISSPLSIGLLTGAATFLVLTIIITSLCALNTNRCTDNQLKHRFFQSLEKNQLQATLPQALKE